MDSAPPTSPEARAATSGATGDPAFTARLARRATPVVRTPLASSALRGPGRLAGTFGAFSNRLGLSQTSRWTLDASVDTSADATDHVRPPINYWPWDQEEVAEPVADVAVQRTASPSAGSPAGPGADEPDGFVPSGDARLDALRRLLTKPKQTSTTRRTQPAGAHATAGPAARPAGPAPTRPVRRGLPQVLHRRGTAVRRPQPGDIARRLRPAAVDPQAVASRPAGGGVPTNLPAAAAQTRAAVPAAQPVPGSPSGERRPPEPSRAALDRPAPTRPGSGTERAAATPAERRPVDLTAAARRANATPGTAAPRPTPTPSGAGPGTAAPRPTSAPGGPATASITSPPSSALAQGTAAPRPALRPGGSATASTATAPSAATPGTPATPGTSAPHPASTPNRPATPSAADPRPASTPNTTSTPSRATAAHAATAPSTTATPYESASRPAASPVRPGSAASPARPGLDAGSRAGIAGEEPEAPAPRQPATPSVGRGDHDGGLRTTAGPSATTAGDPVRRMPTVPTVPAAGADPAIHDTPAGLPVDRAAVRAPAPPLDRDTTDPSAEPGTTPTVQRAAQTTAATPPSSRHADTSAVAEPHGTPASRRVDTPASSPATSATRPPVEPLGRSTEWSPSADPTSPTGRRPDTGTPRPPAATATTALHRSGAGAIPTSPVSTPGRQGLDAGRATSPSSDAVAPPIAREAAPDARPTPSEDPIRRAPVTELPRREARNGTADSARRPNAERPSSSPGPEPSGRIARVTGDRSDARIDDGRSQSPWPVQRSFDPTAPGVELAARTRPPTSPNAGDQPVASDGRPTQAFDPRPAPPLAPRLRAVDDDERSTTTSSVPDSPAASRYRPTWQGGAVEPAARPAPADPASPIGRPLGATAPQHSPSTTPASPIASPRAADEHVAQRSPTATPSSTAAMSPSGATSPATPAVARRVADAATGSAWPTTADTAAADRPADIRRAPVGEAPVRPATSFAPVPGAELAAGHRAADLSATVPGAPRQPDTSASPDTAGTTPRTAATPTRQATAPASAATPDPIAARSTPAPARAESPSAPAAATPAPAAAAAGPQPRPARDRADAPALARAADIASRPDGGRAATSAATSPAPATDGAVPASLRPAPPAVRLASLGPDAAGHPGDPGHRSVAARGPDAGDGAAAPVRRFESVLRRAPAAPAPLPVQWRPLASAIAGERRVRVSTNAASRAALQAAGKRAATTGDVIHLAQPLRGPADAPLLAHELTHVANPSLAPRFFDDERDSPEERRAEMIADVIRRSPVLPRATARAETPALPVSSGLAGRPRAAEVVRRSPSTAAPHQGAPSVTADELVRRLSGASSPDAAGTVRRSLDAPSRSRGRMPTAPPAARQRRSPTAGESAPSTTPADAGTIRRSVAGGRGVAAAPVASTAAADTIQRRSTTDLPSGTGTDGSTNRDAPPESESAILRSRTWPMMTGGTDSSSLRDLTDWIVEQVEDRVLRELERRGGRYRGEF